MWRVCLVCVLHVLLRWSNVLCAHTGFCAVGLRARVLVGARVFGLCVRFVCVCLVCVWFVRASFACAYVLFVCAWFVFCVFSCVWLRVLFALRVWLRVCLV